MLATYKAIEMDASSRSISRSGQPNSPEHVFKIIVIGDTGCGKSAILHQFIEGKFKGGAPKHTIGVEFGSKLVPLGDKKIKLHIWDTSGQERFRSVTHSYYRGALGALVVYDVSNRSTFESLKGWLSEARTLAGQDISVVLCGNKSDLSEEDRQVSLLEGSRFAQENDCMFLETSALSGANVEEVFYKCARTILNKIDLGVINVESPSVHGGSLRYRQKQGDDPNQILLASPDDKTSGSASRMCC